jgi:hypothetical protein
MEMSGSRAPVPVARLYVGNSWITLGLGRDEVELRRIMTALNGVLLPREKRPAAGGAPAMDVVTRRRADR